MFLWTALLIFNSLCNTNGQLVSSQPSVAAGDLYATAAPSVVLIETYGPDGKVNGSGTGFLVSASGKILTNFHVVAHTKRATVRLANGDAYDTVEVLEVDRRKDIALLKIKAVNLPFLKLATSASLRVGDKLYAVGNPLGVLQNTLSEGILSGVRQADGYKLFQLSTPISHGSSGSPVFDSTGKVVAIIALTSEEGQNLNFAIPIDYAAGMLDSTQIRSLESIYEPEERANEQSASAKSPAATAVLSPAPSDALKNDPLTYLATKIGVWTKADAEVELGPPVDRRDSIWQNAVNGDVYKYNLPFSGFAFTELNFARSSNKLGAAYFVHRNQVAWTQVKSAIGMHYTKKKLDGGRTAYYYLVAGRQYCIIVDPSGVVLNVGVW